MMYGDLNEIEFGEDSHLDAAFEDKHDIGDNGEVFDNDYLNPDDENWCYDCDNDQEWCECV